MQNFLFFCRIIIMIRHNITGSTPALTDLCHLPPPDMIAEGKNDKKERNN